MIKTFLLLFLVSSKCFGFILMHESYKLANPEETKVNIASGGCTAVSISNDRLTEYIQEALDDYWNTVPESRLFMEVGGVVSTTVTDNPPEGEIIIGCASLSSSSIGGAANMNIERNGCRIRMNSDVYTPGNYTDQGFMATLIHELGHCVGLHHSNDTASVMTYNATTYVQPKRLSRDDMDGVTYLYPYESEAKVFGGCSAVASAGSSSSSDNDFTILFFAFLYLLYRSRKLLVY